MIFDLSNVKALPLLNEINYRSSVSIVSRAKIPPVFFLMIDNDFIIIIVAHHCGAAAAFGLVHPIVVSCSVFHQVYGGLQAVEFVIHLPYPATIF
jgi:hypothetical protein